MALACGTFAGRDRHLDGALFECAEPVVGPGYCHMTLHDFNACAGHALRSYEVVWSPRTGHVAVFGPPETWRDRHGFEGDDS